MALTLYVIVIQTFITTVFGYTSQYLQYGTPYPSPYITGYPAQSYTPKPAPVYTQQYIQTSYPFTQAPSSPPSYKEHKVQKVTGYYDPAVKNGSYQPAAPVNPVTVPKVQVQQASIKETPKLPKADIPKAVPPFDTNVLNNLAIALQLLIVSNLIHNPPPESKTVSEILDEDIIPAIEALPIPYVPPNSELASHSHTEPHEYQVYAMRNANFLGTSGFGDTGISHSMMGALGSPTVAKPRPSRLMSPYDAIASSPYSETSRTESTRSPYHLSSDYKDLFSLTELFKV